MVVFHVQPITKVSHKVNVTTQVNETKHTHTIPTNKNKWHILRIPRPWYYCLPRLSQAHFRVTPWRVFLPPRDFCPTMRQKQQQQQQQQQQRQWRQGGNQVCFGIFYFRRAPTRQDIPPWTIV